MREVSTRARIGPEPDRDKVERCGPACRGKSTVREPEQLGHYIALLDHDFAIVNTTSELARLLGYKRGGLDGCSSFELTVRPPDESPAERRRIGDELAARGERSGAVDLITRDGSTVPVRYRTLAVRDGEFYVSVAELVVATPLDELRVRAEVAYAEEWLTLEQAVDYSHLSVATVERLEHDGTLRRGGTTGRPLYKRKWLDAALGAVPLLVVAVLLAVTSLLLAELVDVVLPGRDFGFPPGTGHPLSHPFETARDLAVALERLLDGG